MGSFVEENTVLYYLAFANDRVYMKCLVYGIYILEFVQSVLIAESVFRNYELFLTGFGGAGALETHGTTWFSFPILTAIGELSCKGHARPTF